MNPNPSIKIGFIGAGKVGVTLGAYFKHRGLEITGYTSQNPESAQRAAAITLTNRFDLSTLVAESELIWITTPDDQIEPVWNELTQSKLDGKIICHSSGVKDSTVFFEISKTGAFGYSIHPMHAFSKKDGDFSGLETAYFTLEGDPTHLPVFQQMFFNLGNKLLLIDQATKPLYHLANVTVTNLLLGLLSLGCDYLSQCGSFNEEPLNILLPMIENNFNNIKQTGFLAALTGPIERNDLDTIMKHLQLLNRPDACLYKLLSSKLVELACQKYPERDYTKMRQLLATQL